MGFIFGAALVTAMFALAAWRAEDIVRYMSWIAEAKGRPFTERSSRFMVWYWRVFCGAFAVLGTVLVIAAVLAELGES